MNAICKPEWQARATEATPLWSGGSWVITAAGLSDRWGGESIATESLADLRGDLLTWPIMMAAIGPRFDLPGFMHAFRQALRLHGYAMDRMLLRRSEKAAFAMQHKTERGSKAAFARRAQR